MLAFSQVSEFQWNVQILFTYYDDSLSKDYVLDSLRPVARIKTCE